MSRNQNVKQQLETNRDQYRGISSGDINRLNGLTLAIAIL